jgi:hypothetical protein
MPNNATLLPNLLFVNIPFIPDEWEKLLNDVSPFNSFADVPNSLRFGFDMGVHTPPLHIYTPPNHNSAFAFHDHVLSHIRNELRLHRYSSPFSRSRLEFLIGPFRTSPLGTVPKTLGSSERRIVQDLSFPRNDPTHASINDQINIEDFRCDWGTFNDIRSIMIDSPDGTQAATLDVDSAFCCCPIHPSQQQNLVIHWDDSYYVDHNAPFGATSAGGVFGRVADAKSAILESKQIGPSKNWVDDFVFFRFPLSLHPIPIYPYSLTDIYTLAKCLGWTWKESKTRPFSTDSKGFSEIHFLIKSDNQGVIHVIKGGKSRSLSQNLVLQHITSLLSQHRLWISSLYASSVDNLADPPSRGLPAVGFPCASATITLPPYLHPFLSH